MITLADLIVVECHIHPRKYIKVALQTKHDELGFVAGSDTIPDYEEIPLNVRNVAAYGQYEVVNIEAVDNILDVIIRKPKE